MTYSDLAQGITSIATEDGAFEAPVSGACCVRCSATTGWENRRWRASLAIIGSGRKDISLGERTYALQPGHYSLTLMPLAVMSRFSQASARWPFLGLLVPVEPSAISSIVADMDRPTERVTSESYTSPVFVGRVDGEMLDCAIRLTRLFSSLESSRVLGPGYVRQLLFGVLKGPNGPALRHFVETGSDTYRIARAVHRIESNLADELDIEALARSVGMSRTVFFQRFKRSTSSTPVSYQKRLRLLEAQRLMLEEGSTAEGAAYRVGYQSPSQFSREYARLFGSPPIAHRNQLKDDDSAATPLRGLKARWF